MESTKRFTIGTLLGLFIFSLLFLFLPTAFVKAVVMDGPDTTITVEKDEVIDDDLFVFGDS